MRRALSVSVLAFAAQAFAAPAPGGPDLASRRAAQQVARTAEQRRASMRRIVGDPSEGKHWFETVAERGHMPLLREYLRRVEIPHQLAYQHIVSEWVPGHLILRTDGLHTNPDHYDHIHIRPSRVEDLARHGIESGEQFDRHIARFVPVIAGVAGDPTDPAVQAVAVTRLRQAVSDVDSLRGIVERASAHPDLDLIARMNLRRQAKGEQPLTLVIARGDEGGVLSFGASKDGSEPKLMWSWPSGREPGAAMDSAAAGHSQLRQANILTRAELDHAIEHALAELAPEDVD